MNNIFVIIIPKSSAKFLIVHFGFVFTDAPAAGHFIWVGELELPTVPGPGDEALA